MDPAPGYRTTEGAAALLALLAPIGAAILHALTGWQLVAALGIAAVVACTWIAARTWLKRGGAALLVAALLAPTIAHADDPPPAPARAPIVAPQAPSLPEPLPSSQDANPPKLTASQQAACVAEQSALALPAAIAACSSSKPPPPMDTRTLISVIVSAVVTEAQQLGGFLLLKLDPTPIGK